MKKIFVVGAGFMGSGIAQVCAQAGNEVVLMDVDHQALDNARAQIRWSANKLSSRGLLNETAEAIVQRIITATDLKKSATADWVIEAALEDEQLKLKIFQELDQLAPARIPLASNTSSIPITHIARATRHPERVLGLHFFGPVPFMGLVEVVRGEKTSSEIFAQGVDFVHSLGKTPVKVHKDIPGFVMNRIFSAAFKECVELVSDGIVSPADIDLGMRLGYGWNVGPFEIADNAGLDTFVRVNESMHALGADHLVTRSELLQRMVQQGRLGKKAGEGFYRYTKDGKRIKDES